MKILHIVASLPLGGGISASIPLLALHQQELGHSVSIVTLISAWGAEAQEAQNGGVNMLLFKKSWPHFLFFSWGMLTKLHKDAKRVDAIHVHSLWTFPVWWGCYLAYRYKKKLIVSPRGGLNPIPLAHSAWKKRMVGWIDRLCYKSATVIHATSVAEHDCVIAYLGETCKSKIRVIPNGLQISGEERKQRGGSSTREKTVLSLGRMHPLKGLDILMEAWHMLATYGHMNAWKLVIAGPDVQGEKNKLCKLGERFALKNYEMREGVYGEQKWELLKNADVFVLPSRSENFSNVVGEALGCGVPVVMTDVGPWKTEIEKYFGRGVSNVPIQFVATSAPGIADGLSKMMALDDETRAEIGRNGQAWIHKEFQWERVAERMIEVYANACH